MEPRPSSGQVIGVDVWLCARFLAPLTPADLYFPAVPEADLLTHLHPRVGKWFSKAYKQFTPAQTLCVPAILTGRSVLLSSPTGQRQDARWFSWASLTVWCAMPPRAGAHSCGLRLAVALSNVRYSEKSHPTVGQEMGLENEIRIALRTGDTTAKRTRADQASGPPHHSPHHALSRLAILLCATGLAFRGAEPPVASSVVDELHAIAENKRGAHLSISLERLERLVGNGSG